MDKSRISDRHISDGELISFSDCEIESDRALEIEKHLKACAQCRARWSVLSSGAHSYEQFHEEVLKPALAVPQSRWPDLRLAGAISPRRIFFMRPAIWAAVALAACLLVVMAYLQNTSEPHRIAELLARASDAPAPVHRRIRVSVKGQTWSRPALLARPSAPEMESVQALFIRAKYNWDDPLSARSFAVWRSHLREKRDHITYIDDRLEPRYRVQTETADGTLHTASLTLRSQDFLAINGVFEFEDHERVTMADAGQDPDTAPSNVREPVPAENKHLPTAEHPVTAADELRVFAALDQIGADVGEPLTIEPDSANQQIVVSGMGMPVEREQQIRETLAVIPNTIVRFSSAQAPTANGQSSAASNPIPPDANPALRRLLEQSAGGAPQFEAITDQALDASNSLLARSHALAVLAQKFPPGIEANFNAANRETLTRLRRKHAAVIEQITLNLQSALKPLLHAPANSDQDAETGSPPNASWQSGAAELFNRARSLDQSIINLLGANYSSDEAQDVLNRLPKNLQQVEALAHRQARAE